jgi:hypothetical protein
MSKFSDAATTIRKAAQKYEQMVNLAQMLDSIGSLEQIAEENKSAAEKSRAAAAKAKSEADKAKAKLDECRQDAADIIRDATAEGENIVDAARIAAGDQAEAIVKAAQHQAALIVALANAEKDELSSEIGGLQKSVVDAKAELATAQAEKEQIEKALADADKKLAEVKKKLQAFLQ